MIHDLNVGGHHAVLKSAHALTSGDHKLGVSVKRAPPKHPASVLPPAAAVKMGPIPGAASITLMIDGEPAGTLDSPMGFATLISWSGLDIGRDRGSPVGDYAAPFAFTGLLRKVMFELDDLQAMDGDALGRAGTRRDGAAVTCEARCGRKGNRRQVPSVGCRMTISMHRIPQ